MIDICEFAVGLSRQLHGLTIALGASGSSLDRDLASARRRRRHHRVQLPGGSVVVERGLGIGRRQPGDLEAERQDAADGTRVSDVVRAGSRGCRCARAAQSGGARGRDRSAKRSSTMPRVALVSATGSTAMGRAVAPRVAATVRAGDPRTRRQQRRHRRSERRPRSGRSRHRVLGGGHGRATMHHAFAG